ncbi:breast cancer metastasis-suppressor 1-like protein isoform X2 [Melanaphis sacchari]|uniref:breast cancer metastasis-suppressor 1-like protein isoform X2 n=1 Tax=Melanaphis sacchari TaxID=742174 RepID=UPI000DC140AF|nr:breast cancer metastasis-suppressor 1-like protein isoform X2 [Melanaphis sacchari]
MSTATSDNSDIISKIQKITEESGNNILVRKIVCTDKIIDIPYNKKKYSEVSISSLSSSSESNISDSDTDNSSDLNSDVNEKLQEKCDEQVQNIETNFYFLKEMLYSERIREVEEKLVEVRLGTAKEYRIPLQELQDQMKSRLEVASVLRQFKLTNLKHKYEAEEQAIRQNFENNKEILYDTIKADLEEKIQRLEEARNEVDIDASLWLGRSLTRSGRGRGRRPYGHVQPKRKPVIVSGPCIVYNLREHEILEDWTTIKKLLSSSKRKENAMQRYKPYEYSNKVFQRTIINYLSSNWVLWSFG